MNAQENKTDYWTSLPPHSFRIIVWDGVAPAALNDEIAQAIVDAGCAGIQSYGSLSGNAIDADGLPQVVNFDRATVVRIYAAITVQGAFDGDALAESLAEQGNKLGVGRMVYSDKFMFAGLDPFPWKDVLSFAVGTSPGPVGNDNIPIGPHQIARFDAGDIDVTIVQ